MGILHNTGVTNDGLVFGYDTGLPVNTNFVGTRFFPGEPTTNATPLTDFFNLSNWTAGGWSGGAAYSSIYDNALEFTVTNGWRTFAIDHGITSGGTVRASFEYRLKSQQTAGIYGLVLNGLNLGNYHNNLGNISNADLEDSLANGWKSYTGSFTANNNTYGSKVAIGLRGSDNGGLTDILCIRKLQIEQKSHSTPYTETSRSNTASLIDLKRGVNIDVSSVSFNSSSQPDFDGTDDKGVITNFPHVWADSMTMECVVKFEDDGRSIIFGNYNVPYYDVNFEKLSSGRLRFYWNRGEKDISTSNTVVTTNGSSYHHCIFVRDVRQGHFKIYVDGVNVHTATGVGTNITFTSNSGFTMPSGHNTFRFGGDTRNGDTIHNGEIPIIRVYNRPLLQADVTRNFKAYKNRFDL